MNPTDKAHTVVTKTLEQEPISPKSKSSAAANPFNNLYMDSKVHVEKQAENDAMKGIKSELIQNKFNKNDNYDINFHQKTEQLEIKNTENTGQIANSETSHQNAITNKPVMPQSPKTPPPKPPLANSNEDAKIVNTPLPKNHKLAASNIKFSPKQHKELYSKLSLNAKWVALKNNLSNKEAAAIHAYTLNEYYIDINNQFRNLPLADVDISDPLALKNAGVENSDLAELIAAMVTGMKKLPPAQLDNSYFMAVGRNVTMPESELENYLEGNAVTCPTFLSTTVSQTEMVTEDWWNNKDTALFIHQRVNGKGRNITVFSQFAVEQEILFLPYTKFLVNFRGEPDYTKPGLSRDETNINNNHPNSKKILKTLINMQEIPNEDQPSVSIKDSTTKETTSTEKKVKPNEREKNATYFGLR
jgi:hypothetical protein